MARIRSIKPDFWTDESLGECSPSARLLFIATWTFADDAGNLDRSAKQLKAQALPYDALDAEPLLQELIRAGLLLEYDADGKKYLHIKGFNKHQKIENASKPRFPPFPGSVSPPRVLPEPSPPPPPSSSGREGNGEEGKGATRARARPPAQAAAPLVLHASIPKDAWGEWLEHRKAKRWPCDARTLGKQLAELAKHDTETQRQMLDTSIQAGWQGVFAPKGGKGSIVGRAKAAIADGLTTTERLMAEIRAGLRDEEGSWIGPPRGATA